MAGASRRAARGGEGDGDGVEDGVLELEDELEGAEGGEVGEVERRSLRDGGHCGGGGNCG